MKGNGLTVHFMERENSDQINTISKGNSKMVYSMELGRFVSKMAPFMWGSLKEI